MLYVLSNIYIHGCVCLHVGPCVVGVQCDFLNPRLFAKPPQVVACTHVLWPNIGFSVHSVHTHTEINNSTCSYMLCSICCLSLSIRVECIRVKLCKYDCVCVWGMRLWVCAWTRGIEMTKVVDNDSASAQYLMFWPGHRRKIDTSPRKKMVSLNVNIISRGHMGPYIQSDMCSSAVCKYIRNMYYTICICSVELHWNGMKKRKNACTQQEVPSKNNRASKNWYSFQTI